MESGAVAPGGSFCRPGVEWCLPLLARECGYIYLWTSVRCFEHPGCIASSSFTRYPEDPVSGRTQRKTSGRSNLVHAA